MPSIPGDLTVWLSGAVFIIGAYAMAIYLGLIVWTFRDIRARSRDVLSYILAPLLVAIFTLPGLLIYVLLRPKEKLSDAYERALAEEAVLQDLEQRRTCPGCQRRAEADFVVCPYCHHQLRLRCTSCGRLVDPEWDVCPYCGHYHPSEQAPQEAPTAVAAPQPVPEYEPSLWEEPAEDAQGEDGWADGSRDEVPEEAVAQAAPEDPGEGSWGTQE